MSGESPVRMRTVAAHSGAAFEAGQLGHRNGEAPNGEDRVEDAAKMPALGSTKAVCDCVCAFWCGGGGFFQRRRRPHDLT